jgi:hypothetical protein
VFRWLFSRRSSEDEEFAPRTTEIERRLKALEREFDDLHASYRKLRATAAREQRGSDPAPSGNGGEEPLSKQALRDRYLGNRIKRPPSDSA